MATFAELLAKHPVAQEVASKVQVEADAARKIFLDGACPPAPDSEDCIEYEKWKALAQNHPGFEVEKKLYSERSTERYNRRLEEEKNKRHQEYLLAIEARILILVQLIENMSEPQNDLLRCSDSEVIKETIKRVGSLNAFLYALHLKNSPRASDTAIYELKKLFFETLDTWSFSEAELLTLTDEQLYAAHTGYALAQWACEELVRRYKPEAGFVNPIIGQKIVTADGSLLPLNIAQTFPQWICLGKPVSCTPSEAGWWDGDRFISGEQFLLWKELSSRKEEGIYLDFLKGIDTLNDINCWGRHPGKGYARFWWRSKNGPHLTVAVDGSELTRQIDALVCGIKGKLKIPENSFWVSGDVRGSRLVTDTSSQKRGAVVLVEGYAGPLHMQKKGQECVLFDPIQNSECRGARVLGHTSGHTTGGGHHYTYSVVYLQEGASLRFQASIRTKSGDTVNELREVSFDFQTNDTVWKKV